VLALTFLYTIYAVEVADGVVRPGQGAS
jgi:hypothetical protein